MMREKIEKEYIDLNGLFLDESEDLVEEGFDTREDSNEDSNEEYDEDDREFEDDLLGDSLRGKIKKGYKSKEKDGELCFYNKLGVFLEKNGVSQSDLARILDIDRRLVHHIINSENIRLDTAYRILFSLGIPVSKIGEIFVPDRKYYGFFRERKSEVRKRMKEQKEERKRNRKNKRKKI
jgi:transcriptional regulator with XRE-family HTH domain